MAHSGHGALTPPLRLGFRSEVPFNQQVKHLLWLTGHSVSFDWKRVFGAVANMNRGRGIHLQSCCMGSSSNVDSAARAAGRAASDRASFGRPVSGAAGVLRMDRVNHLCHSRYTRRHLSVIGTESECGVYFYSVGESQTNKPPYRGNKKMPGSRFLVGPPGKF